MPEQPTATDPRVAVRRRDRSVNDEAWIEEMLHQEAVGTLASVADGQPFAHMNLFAYDPARHAVYLHTARTGRTRANIEGDRRVCFCVSRMGRLLPARTALEMSVEYAGVVLFGTAQVVEDETEARHGLGLLLAKYFRHLRPGVDYRAIQPEELDRTSVFRIAIEAWSGKRKEAAADFPGAFHYPPPVAPDCSETRA